MVRAGIATMLTAVVLTAGLPARASADDCAMAPSMIGACTPPIVMKRRWAAWKPWALAGGGAVLTTIGIALRFKAAADLAAYDREIARLCADTGCSPEDIPGPVADLQDRAELENGLGLASMVIGGVALIGGVGLALINYPRPVAGAAPRTAIVPSIDRDAVTLTVTGRF